MFFYDYSIAKTYFYHNIMIRLYRLISVIFFSIAVFYCSEMSAQSQFFTKNEKKVYAILKKKNLAKYQNKPLSYFLNDKSINFYDEWSYHDEPPGKLSGINFYYGGGGNLYIRVSFKELKYQKRFNMHSNWDFEKLKKETIDDVELMPKGL